MTELMQPVALPVSSSITDPTRPQLTTWISCFAGWNEHWEVARRVQRRS